MRYAALSMVLVAFLFAADEKLLFDFRAEEKSDPAQALSAEARRNILSAVFPRYLPDERECKAEDPHADPDLEAARHSGQIAPKVVSQADGSFTRSGAHQVAYLIKVGECGGSDAGRYFGTYRLVVFENGRLINGAESPVGDYIETTADVFGDGIKEILITGCGFGQGMVECSASLLSIAGGSLRTIKDFISVYVGNCEPAREGIDADVVRYVPGHPPQFFQEEYKAACPGPGQKPQFRLAEP
jgi:hypothetical protein